MRTLFAHGRRFPGARAGILATLAGAALLLAGCSSSVPASFDPATPCGGTAKQQMKGAYPDLEARIPATIDGREAASRDSGRFCSKETLGSVFEAGVTEVRFGGGIWEAGERGGIQLGAFEGDGLTPALLAEEYRRAADADRGTEAVRATTLEVAGRPAWRIDVVNGNSRQAIVVWGSADGAVVQVVVAADVDEAQLQGAITTFD
ncbi:MAG TPA: hypothetical protein VER83_06525 [Candidatus Nanopelagicales bacterium]|nr:hypothetical protein [Candidatus Nanopelagicales bacterium]